MANLQVDEEAGTKAVENIRLTVRMLLAARRITALELGKALGLNRTPMYNRIQGRQPFTVDEVAHMSALFGVPVQAFFDGPERLFTRAGGGMHNPGYSSPSLNGMVRPGHLSDARQWAPAA